MVSLLLVIISVTLALLGNAALGYQDQVYLYFSIQVLLLLSIYRQHTISSLGAFLLLSLLMFGIRPLYITLEKDYTLLNWLRAYGDHSGSIANAMFLATVCVCLVCLGYRIGSWLKPFTGESEPSDTEANDNYPIPTLGCVYLLLGFQVISLLFIYSLGSGQVTSLYASNLGAYGYLFPQVIQSIQIIIVVIFIYNQKKLEGGSGFYVWVSVAMFLIYTYLMKDVTMFRGFYITGAIGAFLAVMHARNSRVPYWMLILPVLVLLPFFRALGAVRMQDAESSFNYAFNVLKELSPQGWWAFFNSKGDMNIFDTFLAAIESNPDQMPYFFAWVYPLLHWIPRGFWPGKPERGMLVDMSFTQGAPFHPGLIGFYYLDGGLLWMFASCLLTGILLFLIDRTVLGLKTGYMKSALYGIVIINGMYFARGYLQFQVMQYVYMILPLVLFYYGLRKFNLFRKVD